VAQRPSLAALSTNSAFWTSFVLSTGYVAIILTSNLVAPRRAAKTYRNRYAKDSKSDR
jgi:hypothetical protein